MNGNLFNKQIPVEYHKGYLKLLTNLPLDEGEKLKVEIVRPARRKRVYPESNALAVKEAFESIRGIAPEWPDGVEFENKLGKSWSKRIKRMWHEK